MFEFFRLWLVIVGLAMVAGGVALATVVNAPPMRAANRLIERPFWPGGPDAPARSFRTFVFGVCGGTMAGWGATIAILVWAAFGTHQAWVWWSIAAGVAVWFVLDTGRSAWHRVWANVAANVALLVAAAIPLAGTFADFH